MKEVKRIKIRYLVNRGDITIGTELTANESDAMAIVKRGDAELIELIEETPRKVLTKEEEEVLIEYSFSNDKLKQVLAK
jgi:ApbE superfamily uncharacterized protein (UPF0280 family)